MESKNSLGYPKTIIIQVKKVPDLKKRWYVYFYYRNPLTGKYENRSKFNFQSGINRLKTINGHKLFAK